MDKLANAMVGGTLFAKRDLMNDRNLISIAKGGE